MDAIKTSFTSNESIFGKLMQPKIEEAYGAYAQGAEASNAESDWEELSYVWDSLPVSGISEIKRTDEFADRDGPSANSAAASKGAEVGMMLYGPKGALMGAVAGAISDRAVNPNPQGYMTDLAIGTIVKGEGAKGTNKDIWYPETTDKWLKTFEPTDIPNDGQNTFTSVENTVDEGAFSRGMSTIAMNELPSIWENDAKKEFGKDNRASNMIDASMFGSQTNFGFIGDAPTLGGEKEDIFLTFAGGGHSLEFSSSVSSNIDSWGYEWTFEAESTVSNTLEIGGSLSIAHAGLNQGDSFGKSATIERAMAWAKYGDLDVSYSLGDPDPYDKFVVQVSTDKRFGTPIFKTIGGASKCPGEPNTMWREGGMEISTKPSAAYGLNIAHITPGNKALFDITITNNSPYRESHIYGMLLTSSESYTGDYLDWANTGFVVNGAWGMRPFGDIVTLHDVPSKDEKTGALKHTKLSLAVEKSPLLNEYDSNIAVKLVSECEWQMSRDLLYRNPLESNTANLGKFAWERECPKVAWGTDTYNKFLNHLASAESGHEMKLTVTNPDPTNLWTKDKYADGAKKMTLNPGFDTNKDPFVHPNVQFVRIQWRTTGVGEWINAWKMVGTNEDIWENEIDDRPDTQCINSRMEGCTLNWNLERQYFLSGLKDGSYEIRAKVFCAGYDAFATAAIKGSATDENLSLNVDVQSPMARATATLSRVFFIEYSEKIVCPQLNTDHMTYQVKRIKSCDGETIANYGEVVSPSDVFLHYNFVCLPGDRGSLAIKWPGHPTSKPGIYEVTVNADKLGTFVQDANGNIAEKQTFQTSWIDCASSSATATSLLGDELKEQSKRTNLTTDQPKLFSKVSFVHVYAVLVTLLVSVLLLSKSHLENYSTLLMGQQSNKKESEGLIGDADKSHICSEAQRASYGSVI